MANIIVAPFGEVSFRFFFLADILTSSRIILLDTASMICFYQTGEFKGDQAQICVWQPKLALAIAIIPLWWRFAQCLRRIYYDRTLKSQMVNAGKYLTGILSGVLAMIVALKSSKFVPGTTSITNWYLTFVVVTFISSFYSHLWDIYMDWGLLRCTEVDKYALRPVINYSAIFYYYAMVMNFLIRFVWLVPAFVDTRNYPYMTSLSYITAIALLELYRRWFWSLLRIENEQVNNLEKYRHVQDIPEVCEYE